ncbi:MAG: hypothetical protein NC177_13155 [Ruminococcus flavefaciens]|nr:hypothetical protein [Ruminococcus flavefaciens]
MFAEEERRYRAELEKYLEQYFKEYQYYFSTALSDIDSAFARGDVDGVISSTNQITKNLSGNIYYENFDEFKNFLASDEVDVFLKEVIFMPLLWLLLGGAVHLNAEEKNDKAKLIADNAKSEYERNKSSYTLAESKNVHSRVRKQKTSCSGNVN